MSERKRTLAFLQAAKHANPEAFDHAIRAYMERGDAALDGGVPQNQPCEHESGLNERGQGVADALHGIPERWRETALDWLELNGPDFDDQLIVLLTDKRMKRLLRELDNHAEKRRTPSGILRTAYLGIVQTMMCPPDIPTAMRVGPAPTQQGWTYGALLDHRRSMAGMVHDFANALAIDPAAAASLAELLELSEHAPSADAYANSAPAAAPGSAVTILRHLAQALERGDSIDGRDNAVFVLRGHMETRAKDADKRNQQEEAARQRLFEQDMHTYLSMATNHRDHDRGRPFDHFTAAALWHVLRIDTDANGVGNRRRDRRKPRS